MPFAEIAYEFMFLRVEMNVMDEVGEIRVGSDGNASKTPLKEAACTVVGFVDRFGVGVEKVGELLGGVETFEVLETSKV